MAGTLEDIEDMVSTNWQDSLPKAAYDHFVWMFDSALKNRTNYNAGLDGSVACLINSGLEVISRGTSDYGKRLWDVLSTNRTFRGDTAGVKLSYKGGGGTPPDYTGTIDDRTRREIIVEAITDLEKRMKKFHEDHPRLRDKGRHFALDIIGEYDPNNPRIGDTFRRLLGTESVEAHLEHGDLAKALLGDGYEEVHPDYERVAVEVVPLETQVEVYDQGRTGVSGVSRTRTSTATTNTTAAPTPRDIHYIPQSAVLSPEAAAKKELGPERVRQYNAEKKARRPDSVDLNTPSADGTTKKYASGTTDGNIQSDLEPAGVVTQDDENTIWVQGYRKAIQGNRTNYLKLLAAAGTAGVVVLASALFGDNPIRRYWRGSTRPDQTISMGPFNVLCSDNHDPNVPRTFADILCGDKTPTYSLSDLAQVEGIYNVWDVVGLERNGQEMIFALGDLEESEVNMTFGRRSIHGRENIRTFVRTSKGLSYDAQRDISLDDGGITSMCVCEIDGRSYLLGINDKNNSLRDAKAGISFANYAFEICDDGLRKVSSSGLDGLRGNFCGGSPEGGYINLTNPFYSNGGALESYELQLDTEGNIVSRGTRTGYPITDGLESNNPGTLSKFSASVIGSDGESYTPVLFYNGQCWSPDGISPNNDHLESIAQQTNAFAKEHGDYLSGFNILDSNGLYVGIGQRHIFLHDGSGPRVLTTITNDTNINEVFALGGAFFILDSKGNMDYAEKR
jgi:hypothetical protein